METLYSSALWKAGYPAHPPRAQFIRTMSTGKNITLQPILEQQLTLQAARERQKLKIFWTRILSRLGSKACMIDLVVERLGMQ